MWSYVLIIIHKKVESIIENIQKATQLYNYILVPSTYNNFNFLGVTNGLFFVSQESILGAYDGVSAQVNPSTGSRAATGRFAAAPTFRHE